MRPASLSLLLILLGITVTAASEIRDFDLKTIKRLGNELTLASQRADRGAINDVTKRAWDTGIAALKPRLPDAPYEFVVINDPRGKGFLVYALMSARKANDIILGGHYRVAVSADGSKAGPVEPVQPYVFHNKLPPGAEARVVVATQQERLIPVETFIYRSAFYHMPVMVETKDKAIWVINDGKMHKLTKAEIEAAQAGKGKEGNE